MGSLPSKGLSSFSGVTLGSGDAVEKEDQEGGKQITAWEGEGVEGTIEVPSGLSCSANRLSRRSGDRCAHDTGPRPGAVLAIVPHSEEGISSCDTLHYHLLRIGKDRLVEPVILNRWVFLVDVDLVD